MVKHKPVISVVIPVYNSDSYLNQCLESLHNQTYSNIEYIIVDDGSTDDSAGLCDKASAEDDRFRIVHTETEVFRLLETLVFNWHRGTI